MKNPDNNIGMRRKTGRIIQKAEEEMKNIIMDEEDAATFKSEEEAYFKNLKGKGDLGNDYKDLKSYQKSVGELKERETAKAVDKLVSDIWDYDKKKREVKEETELTKESSIGEIAEDLLQKKNKAMPVNEDMETKEKVYKAGDVVEFTDDGIKKVEKTEEESVIKGIDDIKNKKDEQKEKPASEISPEKIKNLEELLGNIEKEAKDKLENGPLSLRMKGAVLNGLDKWENFGKGEEGVKGFVKRFSKMAVNLALIGAISSVSVEKLAEAGIGTATALSGGVTSYLGRKMAIGLGIGGAMELGGRKIPDKVKKWIPVALGVAGVGAAIVFSGGLAGVAAGLSAGAGYATSKLIKGKFTNEKIVERKETAKQKFLSLLKEREKEGKIDLNKIDQIKIDYEKILKKYENQKIWGKLLDGARKLGTGALVSAISMEASGFARDIIHNQPITQDNIIQPDIKDENQNIITPPITKPEHLEVEAVADHGQGAISTLRELQHNLKIEYGNDLENAPESVKHILNTDAHNLAQEYGMYKPGQDAESAFIKSGALFKVDGNGNLTYQEVDSDKSIILESGKPNISEVDYSGKMSDTNHSELTNQEDINNYKLPEQIDPITGENLVHADVSNLADDKYKIPPQVDEVTGQPKIQEETINTKPGNLDISNNLTLQELEQVHKIYNENINHIFGDDEDTLAWSNVKNKTPYDLFKVEKENNLNEVYKPFANYLHKLQEVTGTNPRTASLLNPIPETNMEFIERALQKAQEMGQLDEVKL